MCSRRLINCQEPDKYLILLLYESCIIDHTLMQQIQSSLLSKIPSLFQIAYSVPFLTESVRQYGSLWTFVAITIFRTPNMSFAHLGGGFIVLLLSCKNWLCILDISSVLFGNYAKKTQDWPINTKTHTQMHWCFGKCKLKP